MTANRTSRFPFSLAWLTFLRDLYKLVRVIDVDVIMTTNGATIEAYKAISKFVKTV